MITYSLTTTDEELHQILAIQKINLLENVSPEEKISQGFVTVKHTFDILKKMHEACPHSIAKHHHKVVGFALSMTKDFASDIPILQPMFQEIDTIFKNENYIVMGQICIDKKYRGKGIFKGLYQFMATKVCATNYNTIVTEIDTTNIRSLNAHKSAGFIDLLDYTSHGKNWRIVSLQT